MSTPEERIGYVEGKVEDHSRAIGDLRDLIIALDQKVDRRFESLERRFESLEQRFDSKFNRLITIQLMTLVALVAGLFGTVSALLRQ